MEVKDDEHSRLGPEGDGGGLDLGQHLIVEEIACHTVGPEKCACTIENNGYRHLFSRQ
jgi:hypothetical protein